MSLTSVHILFKRLSMSADEDALCDLHNDYFYRLYKLACSIVGDKETAEEITNDVFIKIWQRREFLGDIRHPEYYLLKCTRNKALEFLRSKKIKLEFLEDDFQPFLAEWAVSPEQIMISSEMVLHINKVIDQLAPKCKLIFLLVKEGDLKYREVAELLNISVKTVEAQMGLALKKITGAVPFSLPH